MKKFNVLIDREYVRDSQINNDGHPEGDWWDWEGDIFLQTIDDYSEDSAKLLIAEKYGINPEILIAIPIKGENEEFFSVIRWHEDDVICAFEKEGIPATQRNLEIFMNSRAPKSLEERCVEEGNLALEILVQDLKDEFKGFSAEDVTKQMIDIYWAEGTLESEILEEWHTFLLEHVKPLHQPILSLLELYFNSNVPHGLFEDGTDELTQCIFSQLEALEPEYNALAEEKYNENLIKQGLA